jgi:uncharacterized membrane protein YgdD (TMEM256/DUF423 family)
MLHRLWITAGGLAGLLAVAMAALAAHGLAARIDAAALQQVGRAVQMQGWHAMMLVLCGVYAPRGGRLVDAAGAAFLAGLLLFCGAVYALAIGGVRLPAVAPLGGFLLMLGWLLLAACGLRAR